MTSGGYRESVSLFGRHGTMLGFLTEPIEPSEGIPVVLLGAGIVHRIGPSRASVHLARALAAAGHRVLRFDLSGIGDSVRAPDGSLQEVVLRDIEDAIDHVAGSSGKVVLLGYCSGADNAFYYAAGDPRVAGIVLFDPTIHRTTGFHRRQLATRLTAPSAWRNVLSGRSIMLRLEQYADRDTAARPPDYYGLLVASPEEADLRATALAARGARLLYLLSGGIREYCNSPNQVSEALPNGFEPDLFSIVWAPHVDHILSTVGQHEWLYDTVNRWLTDCGFKRGYSHG